MEGAGGGGLGAWALITGYGTDHGIGVNGHVTGVALPDYRLDTLGVGVGLFDRLEFSYAWAEFDTQNVGAARGLGKGYTFHQNIFGAKLRLLGDAVYAQDEWLPQISVGLQHKENDRGAVIAAVGGKASVGTDYYIAASKLFLAQSLLANATVRFTQANQFASAATSMLAIPRNSRARWPTSSAATSRPGSNCAPSPATSPSPRSRTPTTFSRPGSRPKISPSPPLSPISVTSCCAIISAAPICRSRPASKERAMKMLSFAFLLLCVALMVAGAWQACRPRMLEDQW